MPNIVPLLNLVVLFDLHLISFYNLLKYYCITSVHWIVPILLIIFCIISTSIDTKKDSQIYFGALVCGFALVGFFILINPWFKFKNSWIEHFKEHAMKIEKQVGIKKEEDKTDCEKLDEKLEGENILKGFDLDETKT
jgi:hypothetical protein